MDTTGTGFGSGRMDGNPTALSPVHHVEPGAPPAIIFHGTDDTTVPFKTVLRFQQAMVRNGNRCTVVPYEGQRHGFFNECPDRDPFCFHDTLKRADDFLTSLGYLDADG